ncbi:unnamed protein product [Adineta ricciae]|uniref:Uncharacterized protein n=1 Tax=Adineta ricciae TaxID=249248 RepID=A0A813SEK1_ADIRI|nr:unnamed protein product [Adineta ricciae]CAF0883845.1 unnamed protein product [Adineta ricciae]
MGCCTSAKGLDKEDIHSPIVLEVTGKSCRYHGTTERGRFQTLGNSHMILTEDGLYSQVSGVSCCGDQGYLYIPLGSILSVREQDWFNGLYRLDRPHLIVTYRVPRKGEFQAGWQMDHPSYEQWHRAIERLLEQKFMIKLQ